jgi:hypothetical protein
MCSASAKAPISNTNSPAQWWLYSDQAMSAALRNGAASSTAAKARGSRGAAEAGSEVERLA